jgi:hypothetical protein
MRPCIALPGPFEQIFIRKAADDLPKLPAGCKLAHTAKQKLEIVDCVGRLYMKRVSIGDAQARVSQQFGVAKRTVERIWRDRADLEAKSFETMENILEFFRR